MSNEVKQRKKGSSKESKDGPGGSLAPGPQSQDEQMRKVSVHGSFCPEARTLLCWFCVAACGALTWVVYQQSQNFTLIEQKYQILQKKAEVLDELEDKFKAMSGKLVSTEDIVAEASVSSSVMIQLQQRMSTLQREVNDIQNSEMTLSKKMQNVNTKFQNITESWRKSLDEMNRDTNSLKSDAKSFHTQITAKINHADESLKVLKERMKDLEDSTVRNTRTVKTQEEDELVRLREKLDWSTKDLAEMANEQSELAGINVEVKQNLAQLEPKLEECIKSLPTIEDSIHTLLRVSKEILELDKKMNNLNIQVFNTEDNLLKTISELQEIQNGLEGLQVDNSILKMQNDIERLKEKALREPLKPDGDLVLGDDKEMAESQT